VSVRLAVAMLLFGGALLGCGSKERDKEATQALDPQSSEQLSPRSVEAPAGGELGKGSSEGVPQGRTVGD
jgi:hypothetical protein